VLWSLSRAVVEVTGEPSTDRPLVAHRFAEKAFKEPPDEASVRQLALAVEVLMACEGWHAPTGVESATSGATILERLINQPPVRRLLDINRHRGVEWFNHEAFEELLGWLTAGAAVELSLVDETEPADVLAQILSLVDEMRRAEAVSGYRVAGLLEAAETAECADDC
jgi:hypothetical protein